MRNHKRTTVIVTVILLLTVVGAWWLSQMASSRVSVENFADFVILGDPEEVERALKKQPELANQLVEAPV